MSESSWGWVSKGEAPSAAPGRAAEAPASPRPLQKPAPGALAGEAARLFTLEEAARGRRARSLPSPRLPVFIAPSIPLLSSLVVEPSPAPPPPPPKSDVWGWLPSSIAAPFGCHERLLQIGGRGREAEGEGARVEG